MLINGVFLDPFLNYEYTSKRIKIAKIPRKPIKSSFLD